MLKLAECETDEHDHPLDLQYILHTRVCSPAWSWKIYHPLFHVEWSPYYSPPSFNSGHFSSHYLPWHSIRSFFRYLDCFSSGYYLRFPVKSRWNFTSEFVYSTDIRIRLADGFWKICRECGKNQGVEENDRKSGETQNKLHNLIKWWKI